MQTTYSALDELLEPVSRCLTPDVARRIAQLRAPEAVQRQMEEFAAKNTEGRLSKAEHEQYESLVSAGNFLAILQSKARRLLQNDDPA